MTLVLKSNNVAQNFIADKHGLMAATDWRLMLDFENEDYIEQKIGVKTKVDLTSVLSTKNTNSFIIDKKGEYLKIQKDTLRLSMNSKRSAFGLLEETGGTNYYFPFNAPISKTIDVAVGAANIPIVCKMTGSGSVSLSGNAITSISNNVLTEDQAVILFTANGSSKLTVNVVGEVKTLSVLYSDYASNGFVDNTTIPAVSDKYRSSHSVTSLEESALKQITDQNNEFSVIFQCIDNDVLISDNNFIIYKPLVELVDNENHISVIRRKIGKSTTELAVRVYMSNTEKVFTVQEIHSASTIAVTHTATQLSIAVDGNVHDLGELLRSFSTRKLNVGSSTGWLSAFTSKAQGVFTKLALYDRKLNNDELKKSTLSFQ